MTVFRTPRSSLPALPCLLLGAVLCCLSGAARSAPPAQPTLRLASLEWLPYVGPGLERGGLSGAVAAAAAAQFNYHVDIEYFPWSRAMRVGLEERHFAGYFPAYYTEERARQCYFSAPMGQSTIGLAYLKDAPLHFRSAAELSGLTIGVVAGYSNGDAFDALVKQGKLRTDTSPADSFNLKKLLAGRVRAAVVDQAVLRYLMLADPDVRKGRARIAFHEQTLAQLTLHVCFQRTPAGLKLRQAFDAALQGLDIAKIENAYFQQLEGKEPAGAR
ncbi:MULTISPECIES: substrate-binding periplasmic protein [unclassified Janthinobacterium]|uniref:substrate-binding periplasmic protein n=1 Tax=unclassified Janthinobacterium TaxID=2610881 RepID=UPI00034DB972|nr:MULTISPECIES: transporter substrate-binding domain-containing protein [unclassified Janthinobacterium]MEC5159285.1 polar amino acid transport system substrate-binding protein [Janthinobacterium sp. CG_S6]